MSNTIPFVKMHGAGNDFIIVDNQSKYFDGSENYLFNRLCHRQFGIGADGLLLIDLQNTKYFHLRYFNSDGKESQMCANGARCAILFMHLLNPDQKQFTFMVSHNEYEGMYLSPNRVKIFLILTLHSKITKD